MPINYSPRSQLLWINILVIIAVFVLGGVFILVILPPGGSRGVAAVTTRGGRMVVLRLPSTNSQPQKQLVVFDNEPLPRPRIVILEPAIPQAGAQYEEMQLTIEQWTSIDNIRGQWCNNAPKFLLQESAPFYDIGIRCQNSGFRSSKRIIVPVDELPTDFQRLLDLFASNI